MSATDNLHRLYEIVKRLRAPDGCPWDREQTPKSLREHLIEEAYECVDAIDQNDDMHVKEELGDVALLVMMIGYFFEERSAFTVDEVFRGINEKLIRRHPHVFSDANADTPDAVLRQWNDIKENVEGRKKEESVLDGVSRGLPPLERAYKLQKKAAKVGFDWTNAEQVWEKVHEEVDETRAACVTHDSSHLEEEIGDLLFSVVNISRYLGVDPMVALNRANSKFTGRFQYIERTMREKKLEMGQDRFSEMDELWNEAKLKGL